MIKSLKSGLTTSESFAEKYVGYLLVFVVAMLSSHIVNNQPLTSTHFQLPKMKFKFTTGQMIF